MDKEKLLKAMEAKKRELEELELAMKVLEKEEIVENKVDENELLKEIIGFPRYFINKKGEIFHEAGVTIKEKNEGFVELFDSVNNKVLIKIEDLLKENFK